MKKKDYKKLLLNKVTISNLNFNMMKNVIGGDNIGRGGNNWEEPRGMPKGTPGAAAAKEEVASYTETSTIHTSGPTNPHSADCSYNTNC